MSMYVPKHKRPKYSCVFYGSSKRMDGTANCRLTTYHVCDTDKCPWYKSEQMMEASFEKARQNYIKNHDGKDEYYQLGYGPKNWAGTRFKNDDEEEDAE